MASQSFHVLLRELIPLPLPSSLPITFFGVTLLLWKPTNCGRNTSPPGGSPRMPSSQKPLTPTYNAPCPMPTSPWGHYTTNPELRSSTFMELHSQQSRQTSETGSPLLSWPCPHGHNLQPPPHHYHYHRTHTIRHAHQTTTNGFMTITPIGSLPSSNRTAPKPALSFKTIRKWQTNSPPTLQRQDLATPPTSDGPASRRYP